MVSIDQKKGCHKDNPNWQLHSPENQFYKNMKFFWGKEGEGHTPDESCAHLHPLVSRGLQSLMR